jgi:hypothetical protein
MKKIINFSTFLIAIVPLAFVLLLSSCEKTDGPNLNSAYPAPSYTTPSDADVLLVAVKTSAASPITMPSIPGFPMDDVFLEIGMGVAVFKDKGKADKVVLNDTELTYTNGVYTWTPNFTNITDPESVTGIQFDSGVNWKISNPNITKNISGFPSMPKITSGKTVAKNEDFTVTNNSISSAQKVLYAIYSEDGKYVMKEVDGNSRSCTFTKAELSVLKKGSNGMVQANAYTIKNETIGGKKVYFINQSSYTITGVTIE